MTDYRIKILRTGNILFAIAVAVCLFNGLLLSFGSKIYHYSRILLWISFAGMLGITGVIYKVIDRLEETKALQLARNLGVCYICLMGIVFLVIGYWMEYTPSGDNFMLYNGAQKLARDGNFEAGSDFLLYFGRYSNQWGFLLLLTIAYRLLFAIGIQNTFYPIVLIQIALYLTTFCSLFRIALKLGGGKGKLRLIYLLTACFPMALATTVLYTDTFAMPFVVFTLEAVLHVLDASRINERIKWSLIGAVTTLIGIQIKMTVLIVLIAAGIVWLLRLPVRQAFLYLGIMIGVIGIGIGAVHYYMLNKVLDPLIYAQEHTPVIHWIMMSIPSGDNPYGGYNSTDYAITWGMMDEGADHEEVMSSIYSRMKDKIYSLRYPNKLVLALFRKNSASMADGTFGMTEMLDDRPVRWNLLSELVLEPGRWYKYYSAVTTGIWMGELFIILYNIWCIIKNKNTMYSSLSISCLGIIIFLMIWEARSRYLFGYVPIFLMLAALPQCKKDSIMNGNSVDAISAQGKLSSEMSFLGQVFV